MVPTPGKDEPKAAPTWERWRCPSRGSQLYKPPTFRRGTETPSLTFPYLGARRYRDKPHHTAHGRGDRVVLCLQSIYLITKVGFTLKRRTVEDFFFKRCLWHLTSFQVLLHNCYLEDQWVYLPHLGTLRSQHHLQGLHHFFTVTHFKYSTFLPAAGHCQSHSREVFGGTS